MVRRILVKIMIKYFLIAILSAAITATFRDSVAFMGYSAYKDILDALLTIASIIFAIIGAWVAIVYPRAVGQAFTEQKTTAKSLAESDMDADYLSELVEILMVSSIVLMVVLSVHFLAPLIRASAVNNWPDSSKMAAFFIVSMLTFSQLYAIFRVILSNYFFLNDVRGKNARKRVDRMHQ